MFFPSQAEWLVDLEAELFAFPGGRHDDQVDSISQALARGVSMLRVSIRKYRIDPPDSPFLF